jgi:(p)ppGpp synthase/HD superfamily hydrolase
MIKILEDKGKIFWIINQHIRVNQKYSGLPYHVHLSEVAAYIKKYIHLIPEELRSIVILAGWGHDTEEDTGNSYNDIKKKLGVDVADLIHIFTNEKGKNRSERANDKYYDGIKNNSLANFIKICDRLSNMSHPQLFDMYKKELSHFKSMIYNGMYDEMWNELENLQKNEEDFNKFYKEIDKFDRETIYRIHLPQPIPYSLYKELFKKGIVPKHKLIKGKYYFGKCRQSQVALWNGYVFVYMRTKFGSIYPEDINHLEDDNGYDLFIPLEIVIPTELQTIKY